MPVARELMTPGARSITGSSTLVDAARLMRELDVGALPICGDGDPAEDALLIMAQHQIRRLPVIDGHQLVGIISQADVARAMPEKSVGAAVRGISD